MLDFNSTVFRPKMFAKCNPMAMKVVTGKWSAAQDALFMDCDAKMNAGLQALEDHLTKNGTKFVCGDTPTIADE